MPCFATRENMRGHSCCCCRRRRFVHLIVAFSTTMTSRPIVSPMPYSASHRGTAASPISLASSSSSSMSTLSTNHDPWEDPSSMVFVPFDPTVDRYHGTWEPRIDECKGDVDLHSLHSDPWFLERRDRM